MNALNNDSVYLACLRNYRAVANYVATRHTKIAIIGAGTRGEFRKEDAICCALLGQQLALSGFSPENDKTSKLCEKWSSDDISSIRDGNSARYLEQSGQIHDLEFILHHVEDLDVVPTLCENNHFEDALQL